MPFLPPPPSAAWRHRDARDGFEVVFLSPGASGHGAVGTTAAVEGGEPWVVRYEIELDARWLTRGARVTGTRRTLALRSDEPGRWQIDGRPAPHLEGCLDVDLESSVLTNAFPVHHHELEIGEHTAAPAAYVRAADLRVERLEQRYERLADDPGGRRRFRYQAPAFDFECELVYDEHGLLLDYPGIATRAA